MAGRAGAGRGEGQLGGFQRGEEFRHGRIRRLRRHHQRERHYGEQRHRQQILVRIVIDAFEPMLVDGDFGGLPDQQSEPVRRRCDDAARADGAAGAGAIFDDDVLAERDRKLRRDRARHHVAGTAGGIGDDQVDRAARIALAEGG
jgi:hypothetical protein